MRENVRQLIRVIPPNMGGTLCKTRNMENAEKVGAESLGLWISYPNKPTGAILSGLGNQPKA